MERNMLSIRAVAKVLAVVLVAIGAGAPLFAQEEPDVAIYVTLRAKELRFEFVPEVTVTFTGDPRNINVSQNDRQNLPKPVQPRVLYRDIGIRLTITTTLANIEQILDEALGPGLPKEVLHVQDRSRDSAPRRDRPAARSDAPAANDDKH
jgi:hypothetical protein